MAIKKLPARLRSKVVRYAAMLEEQRKIDELLGKCTKLLDEGKGARKSSIAFEESLAKARRLHNEELKSFKDALSTELRAHLSTEGLAIGATVTMQCRVLSLGFGEPEVKKTTQATFKVTGFTVLRAFSQDDVGIAVVGETRGSDKVKRIREYPIETGHDLVVLKEAKPA